MYVCFFFFKQKTAYEMRISDWSSDVCSSDLQQPFGQVPFLSEGELDMFESGAGLLHLARKSEKLMPRDAVGEAETVQWIIAAINSIERVTVRWWFLEISCAKDNGIAEWMADRLDHLENVLQDRA